MAGDAVGAADTLARLKALQPDFDPIDYASRGIAFECSQDLEAVLVGVRAFAEA